MELIWRQLSDEYTMKTVDYNEVLSEMARPIFKRFSDTTEKIRDLAFRVTKLLFEVILHSFLVSLWIESK